MTSRTDRFNRPWERRDGAPLRKGKENTDGGDERKKEEEVLRFSPEEEAKRLEDFHTYKLAGNARFSNSEFESAIAQYGEALDVCPKYMLYERAVIHSNIAACHLKQAEWKEAVKAATDALDDLNALDPKAKSKSTDAKSKVEGEESNNNEGKGDSKQEDEDEQEAEEEADEEIISPAAAKLDTAELEKRKADIERIRTKALLRRARARSELGGWSVLAGALEDYTTLSASPSLAPADKAVVAKQLRDLPPRVKAAQEKEMGEMMGKLKELGNGILKPFGLSTDNFQMVKDEKTGGYSMNFNQGK